MPNKKGLVLKPRKGSNLDAQNLHALWNKIGFEVICNEKDLTAKEILNFVRVTASKIGSRHSSFVCCIMTHGNDGRIYGSDSEQLEVKYITDSFKVNECPALEGKPKIFLFKLVEPSIAKEISMKLSAKHPWMKEILMKTSATE